MDTSPVTPAEIRRIGWSLYGRQPGWQKRLAERLGAREATVSRWMRGARVSNAYARLLRSLPNAS